MPHRLAVCSWSLRPAHAADLAQKLRDLGVPATQLALDPLRRGEWNAATLHDEGVAVVSGMMAPEGEDYTSLQTIRATGGVRRDHRWEANRDAAIANAELAAQLALPLVTMHAGFLPEDRADPLRGAMVARLHELADIFDRRGVRLGLETGQERAATLLEILAEIDHPAIGVNFDPANMILYGSGDPLEALDRLAPHVLQVHIKDARPSDRPGETWGEETPVGEGAVPWAEFLALLDRRLPDVDLVIEREAGHRRSADVRSAAALVGRHLPGATR